MSDYVYKAFFSYKRDPQSDDWHKKVKDKIEYWLNMELPEDKSGIFYDVEDIQTGDRWKEKIVDALKTSKCIVCIWSPKYFESKWCVSEWLTFVSRETKHQSLILPAAYHDGKIFPKKARTYKWADFSNYASTMPSFWNTNDAVQFEKEELKKFAVDIALKIKDCPDYDNYFPVIEADDSQLIKEATIERVAETEI